jgi:signal transduction histidine kinase
MKRSFFNLKSIIALAIILFIIILSQSILEYRSSRKAVLNLLNNQAGALIVSVARASEKGIMAYETQQDRIRRHLFTIAEMIDRLGRFGKTTPAELENIALSDSLAGLTLLNADKRIIFPTDSKSKLNIEISPERIAPLFDNQTIRLPLNFVEMPSGKRAFAAAIRKFDGGVIIVAFDAAELLRVRQTLGAGSVIEDIGNSPGVEYAGIINGGRILAASKKLIGESLDGWTNSIDTASNEIKTRIVNISGPNSKDIYEAIGPFSVAGQRRGNILIGMNTQYLDLLTAKLQRDIFWRSLLMLIVAVAAIGGFWVRQNYLIVSNQYNEILQDVQRLENDKAISSRLVAMGELASGVAHEIRNPLNAIRVIIQRLQREFIPQTDKNEYNELTDIIRKETDRINGTIEQFLNFARPQVLRKEKAVLNDCLKDIVALIEPRVKSKHCSIKTEYGVLPIMTFDPELCRQAFLNLLDNALAAVGSEGIIAIKTYKNAGLCVVEIYDNGPGIPDKDKQRVFDLYYTTKSTGTGLGLPTVLRIIREHGGRLDLLDSPLGGALFRMELPLES